MNMKKKELILASLIACAGAGTMLTGCYTGENVGEGTVNVCRADTTIYLDNSGKSSPACHIKLDFMYLNPYSEKDSVSEAVNHTLKQMYFGELYARLTPKNFIDSITNSLIKDYRRDVMEYYRTDLENGVRPEDMPQWYNYDFEITSELEKGRDSIWNYKVITYQNTGGAHPNTWAKWANINARTGRQVSENEIFGKADKKGICKLLLEKIIGSANERLETDTITSVEGLHANGILLDEEVFIPENFLLKADGIEFLYNPYEIAPYYLGSFKLTISNETNGSNRQIRIVFLPYFSKNVSICAIPALLVNFSATSLPSIRAIKKQTAAPAIALLQERMAPCHHPKRLAFARVRRKAGSGAAMD